MANAQFYMGPTVSTTSKKSSPANPYTPDQLGFSNTRNTGEFYAGTNNGYFDFTRGYPPGDKPSPNQNPIGGVRGYGGGSSIPNIDWSKMGAVFGNKPREYEWQDLDFREFDAPEFREWNPAKWDKLREGLRAAISGDRKAGNAQYDQMGAELAAYQNPWESAQYATNPAMSDSMRRMFEANGTPLDINQADTDRGVQADQAFGYLTGILGTAADQEQASRMRSNAGYQRNLNERLDAEQRGGDLMVGMSEAKARELFEQELWQYGFDVALQNWQARTANDQYNNQGVNAASAQNVGMANDFYANREAILTDLIASGQKVPEMAIAGAFNLDPGLKDAMAAIAAGKAA
jgi:hypothetical protein